MKIQVTDEAHAFTFNTGLCTWMDGTYRASANVAFWPKAERALLQALKQVRSIGRITELENDDDEVPELTWRKRILALESNIKKLSREQIEVQRDHLAAAIEQIQELQVAVSALEARCPPQGCPITEWQQLKSLEKEVVAQKALLCTAIEQIQLGHNRSDHHVGRMDAIFKRLRTLESNAKRAQKWRYEIKRWGDTLEAQVDLHAAAEQERKDRIAPFLEEYRVAFHEDSPKRPYKERLKEVLSQAPGTSTSYLTHVQWMDVYEHWLKDLNIAITSVCMATPVEVNLSKVFKKAPDLPQGWIASMLPGWLNQYQAWLVEMGDAVAECGG